MNPDSFYAKRLMILLELIAIRKAIHNINKISRELKQSEINNLVQQSKLGGLLNYTVKLSEKIREINQ